MVPPGYSYDGDRVTGIIWKDGGNNVLAVYGYEYNAAGQLISKTINASTTTYSYDATGQLIQAGGTTYQYDANGNPTAAARWSGSTTNCSRTGHGPTATTRPVTRWARWGSATG